MADLITKWWNFNFRSTHHRYIIERIGYVGVDSGQLFITDPCYLRTWEHGDTPMGAPGSYVDVTEKMLADDYGEVHNGVVSTTGVGDGHFGVYAIKRKKSQELIGLYVDFAQMFDDDEVEPTEPDDTDEVDDHGGSEGTEGTEDAAELIEQELDDAAS